MFRVTWLPGAPAIWSVLWGRASRLPISLEPVWIACPRDSGRRRFVGDVPRYSTSRSPGLLVRLRRTSVAPSARSRGGCRKDCDRADVTPTASLRTGRGALELFTARVARQRHCVDRAAEPEGRTGTMACPARPVERHMPADSEGTPARPGVVPYARRPGGGHGTPR